MKHFFEWARSHGYLPPTYQQNENCGYMNLILLSVYWGFALGLAPHARTAFSIELTSNILQLKATKEDLSRVYLGTKLNFEKFIDLPEFDQQTMATKDFIKTNQFLLTKWLQSGKIKNSNQRWRNCTRRYCNVDLWFTQMIEISLFFRLRSFKHLIGLYKIHFQIWISNLYFSLRNSCGSVSSFCLVCDSFIQYDKITIFRILNWIVVDSFLEVY